MEDMINEFINSLIADGKSKCTVAAYKADLSAFNAYMTNYIAKPLNALKYADMRLWANSLDDSGFSAATRARKIATVRSFFRYLKKMDYILGNDPTEGLSSPKIPKKVPKVISANDAKNLLDVAKSAMDEESEHITYFRDYTIVSMFLFTGIRREELSNIKLSDVNMGSREILIHGKGDKERSVYINDTLMPILSEYVLAYRGTFKTANDSEYLFVSTRATKVGLRAINRIVDKLLDRSGIKEAGLSAHGLRKRFATTVFENTGDIATTSKLLGHSSPTVTMRYVDVSDNIKRAAAMAVNF